MRQDVHTDASSCLPIAFEGDKQERRGKWEYTRLGRDVTQEKPGLGEVQSIVAHSPPTRGNTTRHGSVIAVRNAFGLTYCV